MARLSDLPPEMIRHIGSFLCPDWPGELTLNQGLGPYWFWDAYSSQDDNLKSLFNLSCTAKHYCQVLVPELLRSVGVRFFRVPDTETEERKLFQLLRLLLHNPTASCGVTRKLFVLLPSNEHPSRSGSLDLRNASHQRDIQLLEEAAQGVGFDIWKETFSPNNNEASPVVGKILTAQTEFQPDFLKGFLIGLLILYLRNVQDLTVQAPSPSLMAMANLLRRVQDLRADGGEKRPILHLHSLAISSVAYPWRSEYRLPGDFEALFSLRPRASVYFRECRLNASLAWSSKITSLSLREMGELAVSTLTDLISNCAHLTRFIYTHDLIRGPSIPSSGTILQALKKHASSLEVLCLSFIWDGEQYYDYLPSPCIDSFHGFLRLEALWINCSCFGDDDRSSVLRTLPISLKKLHLAGNLRVLQDDLAWWAGTLTDKSESLEEEGCDPLDGWIDSLDEESEIGSSQMNKSDFQDQVEDGVEEESLGQGGNRSHGDEESEDDEEDDEEDDGGNGNHDVSDFTVEDESDYEHDEGESKEDKHAQDRHDLENHEENVRKEELCEEDEDTEYEHRYGADEGGERKYKHEDRPHASQDKDDQDDVRQNERQQDEDQKNLKHQEDDQEDEDETGEDSGENDNEEDELEHEKRPTLFHMPEELAYEVVRNPFIPFEVTRAFANYELLDFRRWVDQDPGHWYS